MESEIALSFSNMSSAYVTQYRSTSTLSNENWWLGYCNSRANHNLCIRFTPSANLSKAVFKLSASSYTQLGSKPCYYYLRTTSGHPGVSAINSSGTSFTFTNKVATITLSQTFTAGTTYYLWLAATNNDANFAAYIPTSGITCTSTVATYTVSYNANGGTGAPSSQTKTHGTALTLSSTKPTKSSTTATGYTVTFNGNGGTPSKTSASATNTTSYTFSKWNTKADGSGTSYSAGGSYTANASATLYAQYTSSTAKGSVTTATASRGNGSATRTVTINANGGSSTVTSRTSTATITYACSGWYTAASGGSKRASAGAAYTPTATETVFAQWTETTGAYSAVTLPTAEQCTKAGFSLLGFATGSTATTAAYAPGASYTPNGNVTLYAVWKADGLVYIDNGTSLEAYQVFIDNGSGWDQYAPHIDNGSTFVLYS